MNGLPALPALPQSAKCPEASQISGSTQWWPAGAGMIFSQGLMRMREYDEIEKTVRNMDWAHIGAGGMSLQLVCCEPHLPTSWTRLCSVWFCTITTGPSAWFPCIIKGNKRELFSLGL